MQSNKIDGNDIRRIQIIASINYCLLQTKKRQLRCVRSKECGGDGADNILFCMLVAVVVAEFLFAHFGHSFILILLVI